MKEDFLTSQKASNALSKMRVTACTLEELELTQEQMDELIAATGNINCNDRNKTYYITKFNENNYEIISFINSEEITEKWLEISDLYLGSVFCDMEMLEYILKLAKEEGVPPFMIFSDSALKEMAQVLPDSQSQFLQISGVGPVKLKKYGRLFIDKISEYGKRNF